MNTRAWASGGALIAVTFAAGVFAGVGWERAHAPRRDATMMAAHQVMIRLGDELGLDSAQHQRIAEILKHHQSSVDSAWTSMQPRVRLALDSTLHDILGVLRPDQVAKYRAFVEKMHPGLMKH
jgi:hypothetical protein